MTTTSKFLDWDEINREAEIRQRLEGEQKEKEDEKLKIVADGNKELPLREQIIDTETFDEQLKHITQEDTPILPEYNIEEVRCALEMCKELIDPTEWFVTTYVMPLSSNPWDRPPQYHPACFLQKFGVLNLAGMKVITDGAGPATNSE